VDAVNLAPAAIAGLTEWKPERVWTEPMFGMEAMAKLTRELLDDTGIEKDEIDGIVIGGTMESPMFAPSAVAEYLSVRSNFNEVVDLGGATSAGMIWRAAAAVQLGLCECVLVLCPSVPPPPPPDGGGLGSKMVMPAYLGGDAWGSPQGQFEIPAGLVAATPSFAMVASRYMATYGVSEETLAKVAVHARDNAQGNPDAMFFGKPIDVQDVMESRRVADPLKLLEIVMPCFGGGGVIVTTRERALRTPHRPALVTGFGEHLTHKSISYAPEILDTPIRVAAEKAFSMAGAERSAIDYAGIYDCYTITVVVTIEDAGFCKKGQGGAFVDEHDLRYSGGDWPLNTHGGQLGMGQGGMAGGLSHITEAVRQIQGRAGQRQLPKCDLAYANGTGGMMAEQVALILEGA
jgi:acetyl-CoA acetyltransferase